MRVLHSIPSVSPAGGGPIEGLKQLASVMVEQGHTIEVVSVDSPDEPWVVDFPLPVHALGPSSLSYAYSRHLLPWLLVNHSKYDIVVVEGLWQYSGFATWQALHGTQTPYVVFTHGMLDPWFKHTYPLKHFKKSLYWPWGEYRVLRDAKSVCFTCDEERLLARQSFRPYKCNEKVVSYGTAGPDGDAHEQRKLFLNEFTELRNKRLLLFLSRIHVKKGCDLLIDAFARVAHIDDALHLVMAGPDQMHWAEALQLRAEKLGIADRITWTGMLSGDLKWGAYFSAEAFVLPSHQENFGVVVAEALSCGVPVLISNKVNIWREIEADGAGVVEEDTLEGSTRLLEKWLAMSDSEKNSIRQQTKECFLKRFEIHGAAENLMKTLNS